MERSKNTNVFQRNKRRFIILLLAMTAATAMANTPTSGGVVGRNFGTVENGYSDGLVIGSPSNIGGLVGTNSGGTITNSFFDSQRSGQSDNDGRGIPRTTAQMRQQATFALWNLQNIWGMEALTYNGNPFLRTFYPLSRAQITIEGQRVPTNNSTSTVLVNNIGIMPHNTGNPIQPNVQIEHNGQPLTQGTDFQLEFSDNTALSTNTNPARMSIIGMGDYAGTTIGYNFFITDPRDIRTTTVSSIPDQIHRGTQQIRPQVVVRDFNNQLILQEDADYFLDFGANNTIGNNAGSVRIIGDGIYQGEERTVRFNIVEARPINTTNTTIAAINDLAFNWQAQTPQPTITHSQFGILTEGVDFYFTYENNINRGSATIRVNGMGYFAGSVSRTFTILPRHINTVNITPIPEQPFVPGQPATPALTIKDGETNYLVLGRDFTVSYNRNDAPSTEGNLARAIVSGTNNFSGTRTENFVISGGNITIAEISVVWREPLTFIYNGQEQHPTATAVCPDGLPVLLSINTGNARNAREAAYVATASILTGNPRFHLVLNPQTASVEFHITRAPISPTLNIASIRAGETLSPQVIGNSGNGTVRIYYSTSENGTWSTTPFTNQGTYFARAVIEQSQNYLGATTPPVPFAITGTNPTPIPVVWSTQTTFTYNGQEQSPTATATLGGTTFPLVITGAINANAAGETHTATARLATPNVNYELTNATRTFTIAARSLSENAIDPI
ncbi:MAG: hypothetical protein FWE23_11300, partial [Chitinivibrionia bacterium]|nr:hypothetical protein [Chitinivibrionia bacterium]